MIADGWRVVDVEEEEEDGDDDDDDDDDGSLRLSVGMDERDGMGISDSEVADGFSGGLLWNVGQPGGDRKNSGFGSSSDCEALFE